MNVGKKELESNNISDIEIPIDVVYTWVNGGDKYWKEKKKKALLEKGRNLPPEYDNGRYDNHDELLYSLRSISLYMPWVRNIYIITDGQRPDWLNYANNNIKIIDHREIFPEYVSVPTFNSLVIEWFIHRIGGLSERYIYFNDDFIVNRPLKKSDFFGENGERIRFAIKQDLLMDRHGIDIKNEINIPGNINENVDFIMNFFEKRDLFCHFYYNAQDLFKLNYPTFSDYYYLKHAPYSFSKCYVSKVFNEYEEFIKIMAKNQFRYNNDIIMQGLVLLHEIKDKIAILSEKKEDLFEYAMGSYGEKKSDILEVWNNEYKFICIADNSGRKDDLLELAISALKLKFYMHSKFEKEKEDDYIRSEIVNTIIMLHRNQIIEIKENLNEFQRKINQKEQEIAQLKSEFNGIKGVQKFLYKKFIFFMRKVCRFIF